MKGRRLPIAGSDTWSVPERPGDYSGPVDIEVKGEARQVVYFLLPVARDEGVPHEARSIHSVQSPPHVFRECADGSLEIRESIGAGPSSKDPEGGYYWHGYLDEGHVWREA